MTVCVCVRMCGDCSGDNATKAAFHGLRVLITSTTNNNSHSAFVDLSSRVLRFRPNILSDAAEEQRRRYWGGSRLQIKVEGRREKFALSIASK